VEMFRRNRRTQFSMEEMVYVVRKLGVELLFGSEDVPLRINLGTALGKTGLGLQSFQTKRGRYYQIPANQEE